MITFSVRVRKVGILARDAGYAQKEINQAVRLSLLEAAAFWVRNFLRLHFQPGASQRYSYASRGEKYRRIKARAKSIRLWRSTTRVPAPQPPRAWVWTGTAERELTSRQLSEFRPIVTATAAKHQIRVPLRISHPTHPKTAGELGRLTHDELAVMHRVAIAELERLLGEDTTVVDKVITAGAAA